MRKPRRGAHGLCPFLTQAPGLLVVDTCARLMFQRVSEKQTHSSDLLIRVAPWSMVT